MRIALLRFLAGAYALTVRANSNIAANREWVLPGELPATGQSTRVGTISGSTITWEYYTPASGSGSGTVNSVALSAPVNEFAVSGSPITSSGTLAISWNTQTANLIFASPASGGAAVPSFRALVDADIPNHSADKLTTGTVSFNRLPVGTTATSVAIGNDSRFHTQNTDSGTTLQSFQLESGNSGVRIKNNAGVAEIRNAADSTLADLSVRNLTVTGTQTTVNTTELSVADNVITLNSDYVGSTPTENAGFEVNRGTLTKANVLWNESSDRFMVGLSGAELDIARVVELVFTSTNVSAGVVSLTHNLGRRPVNWQVYNNTFDAVFPDVTAASTNTITLNVGTATVAGTWTVVLLG